MEVGGAGLFSKLVLGMDSNVYENEIISLTKIGPIGQKLIKSNFKIFALEMSRGFQFFYGVLKLLFLQVPSRSCYYLDVSYKQSEA